MENCLTIPDCNWIAVDEYWWIMRMLWDNPRLSGPVLGEAFRISPNKMERMITQLVELLCHVKWRQFCFIFPSSARVFFLRDFSNVFLGGRGSFKWAGLRRSGRRAIYTQPSLPLLFSPPLLASPPFPVDIKERECNRCPHTLLPPVVGRSTAISLSSVCSNFLFLIGL